MADDRREVDRFWVPGSDESNTLGVFAHQVTLFRSMRAATRYIDSYRDLTECSFHLQAGAKQIDSRIKKLSVSNAVDESLGLRIDVKHVHGEGETRAVGTTKFAIVLLRLGNAVSRLFVGSFADFGSAVSFTESGLPTEAVLQAVPIAARKLLNLPVRGDLVVADV